MTETCALLQANGSVPSPTVVINVGGRRARLSVDMSYTEKRLQQLRTTSPAYLNEMATGWDHQEPGFRTDHFW
ncbi:hypothetical protein ANCDUO_03592 [Ancylostoma duodenale]|uniref:Uncharacterized protein n=1 Tax=Ancylostoma duodenale TaxID=51022 RepID=A0A0C2D8M7_9BILA|nr:hypothetical protein ANCDUO_03592 [Ancylostoma duodenale]